MNKRILSIVMVIVYVFISIWLPVTSFASSTDATISAVEASIDSNMQVSITGKIAPVIEQMVTVQVIDPFGNVDYLNNTFSDSKGAFNFTYTLKNKSVGKYTVVLSGAGVKTPTKAYFEYGINPRLRSLSASSGKLDPVFNEDTESYTMNVDVRTPELEWTATTMEAVTDIKINYVSVQSGQPSQSFPLKEGENIFTIDVKALSGVTKSYKVTVNKYQYIPATVTATASIDKNDMVTASGNISSGQDQQVTISVVDPEQNLSYINNAVSDASGDFMVTYPNPKQLEGEYKVTIGGDGVENPCKTTFMYGIDVRLQELSLSSGSMDEKFDPAVTEYTTTVDQKLKQVYINLKAFDERVTILVNDRVYSANTPIELMPGSNEIVIKVTGLNGVSSKTYKIIAKSLDVGTLAKNVDATIDEEKVVVISGNISPAYGQEVSVVVRDPKDEIDYVNSTKISEGGNGIFTFSYLLTNDNEGEYKVDIGAIGMKSPVTTSFMYKAINADLKGFLINNKKDFMPEFYPEKMMYSATVSKETDTVTIEPLRNAKTQVVKINGKLVLDPITIPVSYGSNNINMVVSSPDGKLTRKYLISVFRIYPQSVYSNNANLSSLVVSGVTLNETFASETLNYTASVVNSVSSATIIPTVEDAKATVTVGGNALTNGSANISLALGDNVIPVVVTAENGTIITYTIIVKRAAPLVIPVKPAAPSVTNDDTANTVTGIATGMEYKLDAAEYVTYVADTFNAIDFSGEHTLLVRVAAEGINPVSDTITLTFTTNPIPVSAINLNKSITTLKVGATETLTAIVSPDNAINKNVTWLSSNTNVATVADGVVMAQAEGEATITATSNADDSKTAACTVKVDATTPSGYSIMEPSVINSKNQTAVSFTFADVEIGANYSYSIDDGNDETAAVTSCGIISGMLYEGIVYSYEMINGINVSGLDDGTLTIKLILTDAAGNKGDEVASTVNKDTTVPNLTVNPINDNDTSISGTAEPGSHVKVKYDSTEIDIYVATGEYIIDNISKINAGTEINVTATDDAGNVSDAIKIIVGAYVAPPQSSPILSSLAINDGAANVTLSPNFQKEVSEYTANVANSITSVIITPTTADVKATVTVSGNALTEESASINLVVGDNTIPVVVTAEGGTTRTYKITVNRASAIVDAVIPVITKVLADVSTLKDTEVTLDATATVIDGGTVTYQWYSNDAVNTETPTELTGQTSETYKPAVDKEGTFYYYCVVTNTNDAATGNKTAKIISVVSTVTVTAVLQSDFGTGDHYYVFVSDQGITWTAAKEAAEKMSYLGHTGYLATITSEEENNFVKSKLQGEGWLGGSDDTKYTNDVNGQWYWVTGPEAGTKFATQASGGGIASTEPGMYQNFNPGVEPNDYGPGENYLHMYGPSDWYCDCGTWNDYANDESKIEGYVVEFGGSVPASSNNADLSSLTVSGAILNETFESKMLNYTANVANSVTSVIITPTTADVKATVTVNGNASINLVVGDNTIPVVVTAEDGTTRTYTIIVTREVLSNTYVSAITVTGDDNATTIEVNGGTLQMRTEVLPGDATDKTITWSVEVGTGTATITPDGLLTALTNGTVTVKATANDGSLVVGKEVITISNQVAPAVPAAPVAPDTTDTTVPIVTAGAANRTSDIAATVKFTSNEAGQYYTAVVDKDVEVSTIDTTGAGMDCTTEETTANVILAAGAKDVYVVVKDAADNVSNAVKIAVAAYLSSDADLSSLTISECTLNPTFDKNVISYAASVDNSVSSVNIYPVCEDSGATIEVKLNGSVAVGWKSIPLALNPGENTISMVVTAKDGTTRTYTIKVTRM